MRRRLLASSAVLAALVLAPASARADVGRFIPAEPIDGPVEAILGVDLDIARDGTGGVVYVKPVGGVDHVFVVAAPGRGVAAARAARRGPPRPSSQPVDRGRRWREARRGVRLGRLAVRDGQAGGEPAVHPAATRSSPAINPSIDLSINDVAYLSFTNPAGGGGGDVVVARKDRKATAFGVVPTALDINPAAPAGLDTGRSKVAVAADGVALVVWGESGQVFARRVFERAVSVAPQPVSVPAAGPFPGSTADVPDVDVQDDSSFAWVVFRQVFLDAPGGHSRALARRLVGSAFDPPVAVDGLGGFPSPDSVGPPRVDINGRGDGYAATGLLELMTKGDDLFNARDWDAFEEVHHPDMVAHVTGSAEPIYGRDAHGAAMQELVRMFPDIRVHTPYPIQFGGGDWITVVTNVTGTFTGEMALPTAT